MSYAPTRIGNPCIHCGDIKGNCRTHRTGEMHLCVGLAASPKGEISQGYVVIGDTADGRWAQLLPDNSEEFSLENLQYRRLERQRSLEQALLLRLASQMPALERDKYYREILAQLSLHPEDKADLERRGFTDEQIVRSGFKSVERWQKLNKAYPLNLPGISSRQNTLITHTPGYICPIRDVDGLIVGLQVRKRVLINGDDQRYYFLSTNSNIRLNDQVPLAVFVPTNRQASRIGLVEGVGAKPFLTCQQLGISVIGAAGANWASSPLHLKKSLERLQAKPLDEVTLFADAGSVKNKQVVHQYKRTTNLLKSWGYTVNFAWWGQVDKTFPDIDELAPEKYNTIRYLSVAEFEALCIKWGGKQANRQNNVLPIDYAERVAQAQKKLSTLTYPADIVCDPTKKYLPDLVGLVPTKGFLGIKSPKGSGKSTQIKKIKRHCCGYFSERIISPEISSSEQLNLLKSPQQQKPETLTEQIRHKGLGMNFLSINARIALGREQAIKWEFTWIEDADIDGFAEFGVEKLSTTSIIENIGEIGLCWDSLGKIFGRDWSNTLVVIDEIELGLNHVVTSSTCRDRRSWILHTLEHKLRECLDNNGLVIVADADLTDTSLDYLTKIAPGHIPFLVRHDFKGDPWEIDFYTGKRDVVLSQIEDWLDDENCQPIAIALDNQTEAESLSNHLLNKFPYLSKVRGGLIRIDSRATQTDFGKDFVKRPNESIEKYRPKVLIYTPSLGVGCSIDIKHFAHVFGLFFGNLEPSQARQMLARPREPIPRTVWCKTRALNAENESTSYLPSEIKSRLFDYHDTCSQLIQLAVTLAKEKAQDSSNDAELLPHLIEVLQSMMGSDGTWNNPHIDLYCNQVARRNYSLSQLAVQLRQELIDEGHRVNDFEASEKTSTGDAVTLGKDEIKRHDATMTSTAERISFEEAQEIKRKPARTQEEDYKASRAFLERELPGVELSADFLYKAVYKDNRRWLNQAKLYWWCLNQDAIKYEDEKEWRHRLKQFSKGVPFLPDVKTYTPKVEAIIKSGVLEWINPTDLEAEYSSQSDGAKQFRKLAYANRKLIKTALNITVKRDSETIALAQRMLERLGLKLSYVGKKGSRGNQIRYYKLDEELANDPDRAAVFAALKIRWSNLLTEMAQSQAQQGAPRIHTRNLILYNNFSVDTASKPESLPKTDVISHTTRGENEVEEWRGYTETVVSDLSQCDCVEALDVLRSYVPKEIFELALSRLSVDERQRIGELMLELEWNKPEDVAKLTYDLSLMEDRSMLEQFLQCEIPKRVLQIAAKSLEPEQREKIRGWVLEIKSEAS